MGNLYDSKPEEAECLGCIQEEPTRKLYAICQLCEIRDCIRPKGYYTCHQCTEWPCDLIESFPISTGCRVMKRTIPIWQEKVAAYGDEKGSEEWARSECEHYHCPECGYPLFKGAQRCRNCKAHAADLLDGPFELKAPASDKSTFRRKKNEQLPHEAEEKPPGKEPQPLPVAQASRPGGSVLPGERGTGSRTEVGPDKDRNG